ncbi:MAG: LysR family transcriptional regulator [Betaproteobacteria bacterium]|nr:LysR family transcriptional regulator [Betaproteobacteria bacterium]
MIFEDLSAFVVVAKLRSFSKAAVQLRIAQSSLSKRVRRLERRFGVELLTRHGRGVSLTEAGAILTRRAENLIAELDAVERDVCAQMTVPTGEVRIALPPATGHFLAPLIIEQCRSNFPMIKPLIREGTAADIHGWLSTDDVDIALMYNPECGPEFEIEPFLSEPLFLIAPARDAKTGKAIAYQKSYSIKDLADLPLCMPRRPHSIRVLVDRLCAKYGVKPRIEYEINGINSSKGLVEKGIGVAIFGYAGLRAEIDSGRLRAIPFSSPLLNRKLCVVYPRRDDARSAILNVKAIIEQELGRLLQEGFWQGAKRIREL